MKLSILRLAPAAAAVSAVLFAQAPGRTRHTDSEEGYTAAEIRKIYFENTLRLMSAVERAAHGGT